MKFKKKYFHCRDFLQNSLKSSIEEIYQCVDQLKWRAEFSFETNNSEGTYHQRAYNKAFESEFLRLEWDLQPLLLKSPRLIGDFRKGLVFHIAKAFLSPELIRIDFTVP